MSVFASLFGSPLRGAAGAAFGFGLCWLLLAAFQNKLPRDGGRDFAFNGKLTAGRPRGAGVLVVPAFLVTALLFVPFRAENAVYLLLVFCAMLSGYLDDRSETPWNEYKKGAIDLAVCVVSALTFVNFNPALTTVSLFGLVWQVPLWLYVPAAAALLWVAINATNCSDGVDGLCGTLTIVTLSFIGLLGMAAGMDTAFLAMLILFVVCILPYLWRNAEPCQMMMGDAGSRAFGLFIGLAALKTGNALLYIPLSLVLFLDGFLGIIKVSLARFCKIRIMKSIRTPLHDHFRKNKGWSNAQTVARFAIVQAVVSLLVLLCR